MKTYSHVKCLAVAIAFVCFFLGAGDLCARAQQADASAEDKMLNRIIDILNSTAADAKKWDDKAIAARTQAQIADLLWELDRENAINHLRAAWEASAKVEEPKREHSTVVNPLRRNAVRREVLLVARKRAPELATKWLDELIDGSKSDAATERGTFDDRTVRSAVLLQMANELVAENPKAAAELLTESLRDGISFNFQTVLIRLQEKDAALGQDVFRAALARLRTAGMSDPNELLILQAYLYTPGRVFATNTSDNRNQMQLAIGGSRVSVPAARQNPAVALEFLELASDLLLSATLPEPPNAQPAARSLISVIQGLLREVTERLPEKAALLRARAQQLDSEAQFANIPAPRATDIPDVRPGETKASFAERRVDLLEEGAAKGRDPLTRDIGYAKAAVATTVERYQRGLDLTAKIDDKNLRDGVRSWLIYRAVLHFISNGDLDAAYRLNLKNDDAAQRAVCLVAGAQRLVKEKDTVRAHEWLREGGAIVRRSDADEGLARIALGIVSTYGRFDTQAAIDWLVYSMKLIRKASPAALNDDRAPSFKRISGVTPISDFTSDTTGFSLQSAVGVFSREQFEQVLSVFNDLTPQEARGLAVVTLCNNFLKANTARTRR